MEKTVYLGVWLVALMAGLAGGAYAQEASAVGSDKFQATTLKLNVNTRVMTAIATELHTSIIKGCTGHAYGTTWTENCPSPYEAPPSSGTAGEGKVEYTCISGHAVMTKEACR